MDSFVYIHGVSPLGVTSHRSQYDAFHKGLAEALSAHEKAAPPSFAKAALVEWGISNTLAGDTASLSAAQKVIADRVNKVTPADRTSLGSLVFAPAIDPVRRLVQEAWADLTYYVSEKGKARVRAVVWQRILERVGPNTQADLTIIGHSAGSLIAVDFAYWLFSGDRDLDDLASIGIDPDDAEKAAQNWRIRRLVTFGSPLAALSVRSPEVTDILARNGRLAASDLGLTGPAHSGSNPVWLNVWDRHDVLAYPVRPLYDGGNIHDLYPDHSDSLLGSHEAYWTSSAVHHLVAKRWDG